jgi:hypothetical protein
MKFSTGATYILALAMAASSAAQAAEYTYNPAANAYAYYNYAQIQRQNNAARQHGIQMQQRLCASLRAQGRVALPAACR